MDNRFVEIPPQGRPQRLGQPYHGLVINGDLTLSTGAKLRFPGSFGDCYKIQVPGTPALEISPAELAIEAAAGREWRTYALLSGRGKLYGGVAVGADAWLYAAPDGTVWRIKCLQLDTTSIRPTQIPGYSWGYYPADLDFQFEVSRFGVISPDGSPDTAVINKPAVRIGPETGWRSDAFRDSSYGSPIPAVERRFPGDGYMSQYMPLNIDDVSSTGARCLICCNRSAEQSTANLGTTQGRAYPLAWLEVTVSGEGTADAISIAMSLIKTNPTEEDYTSTWDTTMASVPDGLQMTSIDITYTDDHGDIAIGATQRTGVAWTTSREVPVADHRTQSVPARAAGGFYGAGDTVLWAAVDAIEIVDHVTGTGIHAVGGMATRSEEVYSEDGHGPFTNVAGAWPFTYTVNVHQLVTVPVSVRMGGHTLSLTTLELEQSASLVRQGSEPFNDFDAGFPSSMSFSMSARIKNVFGEFTQTATDWSSFWGGISINGLHEGNGWSGEAYMGAFVLNPNLIRGINARDVDHLRLVRMTNKCYAVVASGEAWGWPFDFNERVVAIGTPDGWTMINANGSNYLASYNPGTGQFASSINQGLGWV